MLNELTSKGHFDSPLEETDLLHFERVLGKKYVYSAYRPETSYDRNVTNLSCREFIPKNGYHPVHIHSLGNNKLTEALSFNLK